MLPDLWDRYTFIYPFMFTMASQHTDFDPMAQCYAELGLPSEYRSIQLPNAMFSLGKWNTVGLRGDLLFAVPKDEWSRISRFVASSVIASPNGVALRAGWQRLSVIDPFMKTSRPVDVSNIKKVSVWAIVPIDERHIAVWENAQHINPVSRRSYFRVLITDHTHEASLGLITREFFSGNNDPVTTVENQIGPIEYDQPDAVLDDNSRSENDDSSSDERGSEESGDGSANP